MVRKTKQFDTLKEAKEYVKSERKQGKQTNMGAHKEHLSYRGRNKTFYDVRSW